MCEAAPATTTITTAWSVHGLVSVRNRTFTPDVNEFFNHTWKELDATYTGLEHAKGARSATLGDVRVHWSSFDFLRE